MYRFNVKVSSMTFGANESGIEPIYFYSNVETLTVRDLIARTVKQQLQTLLEKKPCQTDAVERTKQMLTKQYLSEQDIAEMATQGSVFIPDSANEVPASPQINVDEEIQYACEAFRLQRFFITVNNEQPSDLDEQITLTENSKVLFVRLMPLVGG